MSDFHKVSGEGPSSRRLRRRAWGQRHASHPRGERAPEEAARDLFLRGHAAENAGNPGGALDLYMRALALPEAERHPIHTATILHHLGNCCSQTGDRHSAWEAYVGSAQVFHERLGKRRREEAGHLSDPLGEAGLLLVDFQPPIPIREAITHALLLGGLADAVDDATVVLLGGDLPSMGTAQAVHRKLTGIMLLASGAAADVILETGGQALYQRVSLPFSERPDVRHRVELDGPRFVAAAFDALARLYDAVGKQERPERAGINAASFGSLVRS